MGEFPSFSFLFFFTYNLRTDKDHLSDNHHLSEFSKGLKKDLSRFPRKTETQLFGYFTEEAVSWDPEEGKEFGEEGQETKLKVLSLKPEQMAWTVQKQL